MKAMLFAGYLICRDFHMTGIDPIKSTGVDIFSRKQHSTESLPDQLTTSLNPASTPRS